ncbi:MAG: SDR family NAD(P)-dependent oxidoreductase [Proteobacteria bacterium]|nr:SDR family NAD(P)-dependent oxidoreductase [Pseudomonadota bacterium]
MKGTTAVVTGASRGIGRAIALALAGAGADVALWARDAHALDEVAAACRALGVRALASIVDVTDVAQIATAATAVRQALSPVRVVVNNAGAVVRKATIDTTDDEWRHVLATNLDGTFAVTRALLPDLLVGGGRIINIASIAGREGTPLLAAYCAAKHGVIGLTRSLAEELRAAKIAVNAVCPGSVDTAMLREGLPDARPDMTPDDIAQTVLFLATTAPMQLTGSCIDVFG